MKVYVVVENWGMNCDFGNEFKVFGNKEKALEYFKTRKEELKKDKWYDTIEEKEESLYLYIMGDYRYNNNELYIVESEVK